MQSVVFFRNVNQGQRGHPAAVDLRGALADCGFAEATPFQSNGTVVVRGVVAPDALGDIESALAGRTGLLREVFALPLAQAIEIVEAHGDTPDASRRELTLYGGDALDPEDAATAREAAHRRCRLIASGVGWAVSVNERERESNATPVIERLTGTPATSRGFPTLRRLIERFAS
ncbi:DUF1697 domain-containing protein [Microbacterium sp. NPDC057407]|uniref:DUF1697 domain-containing protein n=1 Tax=Microbacterium sp. NPDC057407 TaxID=3346120 RepID=UPI00366D829F